MGKRLTLIVMAPAGVYVTHLSLSSYLYVWWYLTEISCSSSLAHVPGMILTCNIMRENLIQPKLMRTYEFSERYS